MDRTQRILVCINLGLLSHFSLLPAACHQAGSKAYHAAPLSMRSSAIRLRFKLHCTARLPATRRPILRQKIVVDPEGLEPSTFSLPLRRATNCAMGPGEPAPAATRRCGRGGG